MTKEYIKKRVKIVNKCWEWNGYVKSNGYGEVKFRDETIGSKRWYAHRLSYLVFNGNLPDGLDIHHVCENRKCVNPKHLKAVTRRENLMASDTEARRRAMQTHCKRGHIFDKTNTYNQKSNGKRTCRKCQCLHEMVSYRRLLGIKTNIDEMISHFRIGGVWI